MSEANTAALEDKIRIPARPCNILYFLHIDLFADTATILISIVSNSYYGMPRGQIHINLPPEHPIMSFETVEIKMASVSAKRSIGRRESRDAQNVSAIIIVGAILEQSGLGNTV